MFSTDIKFFKIIILALITSIAILFASRISNSQSSDQPLVWTTSAMEAIERNRSAPLWLGNRSSEMKTIQLMAAKGEYEPFQIVIKAPQDNLSNVNVTVSELTNSEGAVIDSQNITLYREHYIYVDRPSPQGLSANPTLGKGWYADGLIPFVNPETQANLTGAELEAVPFNLKAGNNQPIWVDVFVPRDARAGQYQGIFTVTSDQGVTTGKILLKVWDFEFPLKPSLNSEFQFYEHEDKNDMVELLKHKIIPQANYNPVDERELIEQWGLTSYRLNFWSGANVQTCSMEPPPSVDEIRKAAAKHQSDLFLYARYADEIDKCPNLIEPMKHWARNFHKAGISTAIAMTPTPALYDDGSGTGRSAVDIWIVLPKMYDAAPQRISEVLQKGDKVWFYNALVQDGYSPKWLIGFKPINYRIPHGFINQSLGLTGVLYWRVDWWMDNPWHNVQTYSFEDKYYPGEGMLVYP
ncbi:MAG: glycoside hydrolase domain-containing protein, partial [Waterburya sp.]